MHTTTVDYSHWQSQQFQKGSRYYEPRLCQDLWGQRVILRTFGSLRTRQSRTLESIYPDYTHASQALRAFTHYRANTRHYMPLTPLSKARSQP